MNEQKPTESSTSFPSPVDFSIVLGGPLFQLLAPRAPVQRCADAFAPADHRLFADNLVAPACCSRLWEGHLWGATAAVPFLKDVEVHARFLLVVPLLIIAEFAVHRRIRPLPQQFLDRKLIPEHALPRFDAAIASALRLRNSMLAEVLLLAFVYGVGVFVIWRQYVTLGTSTWYATPSAGGPVPSLGRTVVRLGEHADLSVPAVPLVLQIVPLGPLSLAGVSPRVAPDSDPSRPRRRPEFSFRNVPCIFRARGGARCHGGRTTRGPHFLPRGITAPVQG